MKPAPTLLLFGGSFNPPHCGHMRIAIECVEAFPAATLIFIPCATPPHKASSGLLPFALRCSLLRAALASLAHAGLRERLSVSEVESERQGPSYTVDTLRLFSSRRPHTRTAFILGSEDYARLPTWKSWESLPGLADLVVLPRGPEGREDFDRHSAELWPGARPLDEAERLSLSPSLAAGFSLAGGGRALYLPQPLLDVSSSMARARRAQGKSLDFLLPAAVIALLDRHQADVDAAWSKEVGNH